MNHIKINHQYNTILKKERKKERERKEKYDKLYYDI